MAGDEGSFVGGDDDDRVGLGHRRLAVIDLAGGVQPMQAEEGRRVVASLREVTRYAASPVG